MRPDVESLSNSMMNATELTIARLENNDGTIYPRGLCPCLSKTPN